MLPSTSGPHVTEPFHSTFIHLIGDLYEWILWLGMFSICIVIELLFLYDWYIALYKEQLMEKMKRAPDELEKRIHRADKTAARGCRAGQDTEGDFRE